MSKIIYVLGDINSLPQYFNTRKEADRTWRSRDEPERIETVDAAKHCTQLSQQVDELEDAVMHLTFQLLDLLSVVDNDEWRGPKVRGALRCLLRIDPSHIELPDLLRTYERLNSRPHPDAALCKTETQGGV